VAGIEFDGRVAVITGAGGGLGRSHALLLASRGAKVVVNDLGGARDGTGTDASMADQVVAEIEAAGGEAVANHDGVHTWEGGQAIVQTALDAFGRVDIVINNAGILRDVSFGKLTQEQLDPVQVHLLGAFHVTRAAWGTMQGAGLRPGDLHHLGVGAVRQLRAVQLLGREARPGRPHPDAGDRGRQVRHQRERHRAGGQVRMTEDIMPAELLDRLEPEYVSPLVAYLTSEACTDTGRIFSVGGGYVARVALLEGAGATFDTVPTPEDIADAWSAIEQVGPDARELTQGVMEQTGKIVEALGIDVG
jgi:hypothetical protein